MLSRLKGIETIISYVPQTLWKSSDMLSRLKGIETSSYLHDHLFFIFFGSDMLSRLKGIET